MKVNFIKQPGGVLIPVNDSEAERMNRFKTGGQYEIEIKTTRNPDFHRKVFAFFGFCFEHWAAGKTEWKHFNDSAQREVFRKNLTVLAGYKEVSYTIDGRIRVEAKSLAYGNMEQEEFEQCYSALINAALEHVFNKTADQNVINQLYAFF